MNGYIWHKTNVMTHIEETEQDMQSITLSNYFVALLTQPQNSIFNWCLVSSKLQDNTF
jgi:hypothetical protein